MQDDWGNLLAGLLRRHRRPDLVEDALAEAFAQAAQVWPDRGVPANPAGWLRTAADRRVVDSLRREAVARDRAHLVAPGAQPGGRPGGQPGTPVHEPVHEQAHGPGGAQLGQDVDDRLALIFMCTHPALAPEVRPALALRFVMGVPTETIARLFLVPGPTMAARLTRAKKRLAGSGIPFAVPDPAAWPQRVVGAARAIYLAFTTGYAPGGVEVVRARDAGEAVRLALLAERIVPDDRRVLTSLSALLLLQHSRRDARTDEQGRLVLLADQDRSRWHRQEIDAAVERLARLPPTTGYGEELRLQAVIAACHALAPSAGDTDWRTITAAYLRLEQLTGSPLVRLNRAVALAELSGPMAGLALLKGLDERLPGHHRVATARAELLRRGGHVDQARAAYLDALAWCPAGAESRHLHERLSSLDASGSGTDA
ncbi:RNA polymerase sigma-70 factor (ECF subfamily) [Nocardioides marinisabuli]|uniref:RNA polymerase sigma-70 factor (ECF subfamily) n=1 Tax=Nocardioides marinisabuli TaxID=419476 RepID=A0A7Y9JSE2_9ACTN|nr:DUF6596 domain-containing protein [Nocardioides marinisabuli]NYD58493.1 RNA polymerase sigma-70 factor (ECF subfamily) [Nocardioides marinisabuli]